MPYIHSLSIKHFRGIEDFSHTFGEGRVIRTVSSRAYGSTLGARGYCKSRDSARPALDTYSLQEICLWLPSGWSFLIQNYYSCDI